MIAVLATVPANAARAAVEALPATGSYPEGILFALKYHMVRAVDSIDAAINRKRMSPVRRPKSMTDVVHYGKAANDA